MQDPTFWELPGERRPYRDDRRNISMSTASRTINLPRRQGPARRIQRQVFREWRGGIGYNWEARIGSTA